MADVTKTNTFDKLISEHTGALPDISRTNYLEVDEPDEVENVEEAINASIEDNKQATNDAIALAMHYQKVKESKLKMLTGMIEPASKIFKYMKAREANEDVYENYEKSYKNKGQEVTTKYWDTDMEASDPGIVIKGSTVDSKTGIEKTKDQLIDDQLALETKVLERLKDNLLSNDFGNLSLEEQQVYLNDDKETITNKNANQATVDIKDNFETQITAQLGVQKKLCVDGMGCMDTPMSYFEATEPGRSAQEAAWIPYLYKDAIHDFNASNADLIQAIGKKRYIQRVFPTLMETGDQIKGKVLSSAVNQKLENRKNDRYVSTYNEWKANGYDNSLLWGDKPGSFININEVGLDGSKDNVAAWNDFGDMLIHWHKKGYINTDDLLDLIEDPTIPVRGSKDKTKSMGDLNKTTAAVSKRIRAYLADEPSEAEIARDILVNEVGGLVNTELNGWTKKNKETGWIPEEADLTKAAMKISQAVGGRIGPTDPLLRDLYGFVTTAKNQRAADLVQVNFAKNNRLAIPYESFARLPLEKQREYLDHAKIYGFSGWTKQQDEEIDESIYYLFEKTNNKDKVQLNTDYETRNYHRIARTYFDEQYTIAYNGAPTDLKAEGKQIERKSHARAEAFMKLEEKMVALRNGEAGNLWQGEIDEISQKNNKESKNISVKESQRIGNYIDKNRKSSLIQKEYISDEEKTALIEFELWKEDPENNPFPVYFADYSKLYKGTYTNDEGLVLNKGPLWYANHRYEAMTGETGELPDVSQSMKDNVELGQHSQTGDVSKLGAVISSKGIESVIEDFENPNATDGFDTVSGAKYPWGTKDEDQWVLPEGLTVSTATIGELIHANNRNEGDLKYGMYDIPASVLKQMLIDGTINKDSVFDEDTQKLILTRRILTKANRPNALKNIDSTFRRLNWLEPEEVEEFKTLLNSITGDERFSKDPYYALTILNPSAAKAVLNMSISGDVGSEESTITNLGTLETPDITEPPVSYSWFFGTNISPEATIKDLEKFGMTVHYLNEKDAKAKRQLGDRNGPLIFTVIKNAEGADRRNVYLGWTIKW